MFIRYYSQLVCCMSAKAMSPYFVTENIISDQDHQKILNVTSHVKAASLLLSKVSFALKADFNESFYKFLNITEQYGNIESKTIATAIKKKLLDLKCEVQGVQKSLLTYIAVYVNYIPLSAKRLYIIIMCFFTV